MNKTEAESIMRRKTRRSFLFGGAVAAVGFGGARWLYTRREDAGIRWPLRRWLEINEHLARDFFHDGRLAPTFPLSMAKMPRENGGVGLQPNFDAASWNLRVEGGRSDSPVTLDQVRSLPRIEIVTELKCVEGWSEVVHFTGARFSDFAAKYGPEDPVEYVGMETPDGEYYVGLDADSAMHPQTLLCYEMGGKPLTAEHGAPLRLAIPVKYGLQNIKRIGKIRFAESRPADYWAERGYDWYVGL
ncbi:MAG: molybdopterin-binding oxidoreductase [Bryobacterales bacterium]|nr:molybdopterin-binding oxidoreductase [Bryobacterales bacterium]